MTELQDAELLRERMEWVASRTGVRAASSETATGLVARLVAAHSAFSDLGRDLSTVATRGLVIESAQPAPAGVPAEPPPPREADWTEASVNLEIAE